jgi:NADH-quinone oxidoreductase subunit K
VNLASTILLASALFAIGVYGLLTRRHLIGVLLSVELMANAANLSFVAFARYQGGLVGQTFALFALAITVAEVAVGLALVILLYRTYGRTEIDAATEMKG